MTTLRKELINAGIDWRTAELWLQAGPGGYASAWYCDLDLKAPEKIDLFHEELDREIDTGYGKPDMARFYACDSHFIYLACQYDGSTGVFKVPRSTEQLADNSATIPYPGG